MQQRRIKGNVHAVYWWDFSFFLSMRVHDLHCVRPRANIAENLLFLKRHSMREASRMKLQFL